MKINFQTNMALLSTNDSNDSICSENAVFTGQKRDVTKNRTVQKTDGWHKNCCCLFKAKQFVNN
jgi:hypothetical protein